MNEKTDKDKEIKQLKEEIATLKRAHNMLERKINQLIGQHKTMNDSIRRVRGDVDILRRR